METTHAKPPAPRPRRNWRQFSLRALLLAMAVFSVVGAWVGKQLRWKDERAAARTYELNIETAYELSGNFWNPPQAPTPDPPTVLKWFGETEGTTAVVLDSDPDQSAAWQADRARLTSLFPEAKIAVLGEPDCPLDLVGFTLNGWQMRNWNIDESRQRFKAARLERQALADARCEALAGLTRFDHVTSVPRADRLGQLLRVEGRLLATQLDLAATRRERAQLLDARSQQLIARERAYEQRGQEPAAGRGVLACRVEQARLADDRAWLDRPAGRHDYDGAEVGIQRERWISECQLFQKTAALYVVGAKGGEAHKAATRGLRLSRTSAQLAEIQGDQDLARVQWLHAGEFGDMAVGAYSFMLSFLKELNWFEIADYCQLLADRAEIKLARVAYLKRTGRWPATSQGK